VWKSEPILIPLLSEFTLESILEGQALLLTAWDIKSLSFEHMSQSITGVAS
jgi:hypothetical protein